MYVTLKESGFCCLLWYLALQIPASSDPCVHSIRLLLPNAPYLFCDLEIALWQSECVAYLICFPSFNNHSAKLLFSSARSSCLMFSLGFWLFRAGGCLSTCFVMVRNRILSWSLISQIGYPACAGALESVLSCNLFLLITTFVRERMFGDLSPSSVKLNSWIHSVYTLVWTF